MGACGGHEAWAKGCGARFDLAIAELKYRRYNARDLRALMGHYGESAMNMEEKKSREDVQEGAAEASGALDINAILLQSGDHAKIIDGMSGIYAGKELCLRVSEGKEVFYRGEYVREIALSGEELLVGRRDVMAGHYPDIDLAMYWKADKRVSRRHLRFYFNCNGSFFVEDLCNNQSTFLNDIQRPINRERIELHLGDRVKVSQSVVFEFRTRGEYD